MEDEFIIGSWFWIEEEVSMGIGVSSKFRLRIDGEFIGDFLFGIGEKIGMKIGVEIIFECILVVDDE